MSFWTKCLLAVEASLFGAASTIHAGIILAGYEHERAATAEFVIATVLMIGLVASLIMPKRGRTIGLAVQAIALLGTGVGAFTIAIGIGPQTVADHAFHFLVFLLLIAGLIAVFRSKTETSNAAPPVRAKNKSRG